MKVCRKEREDRSSALTAEDLGAKSWEWSLVGVLLEKRLVCPDAGLEGRILVCFSFRMSNDYFWRDSETMG